MNCLINYLDTDNPLKNINVFSDPNQNVKFILKDGEIIKNILN